MLGLPTGSTPICVYRELARIHKEGLNFSNVMTFNLDEYFPMEKDRSAATSTSCGRICSTSQHSEENIHIPDGTIPLKDVDSLCEPTSGPSKRPAASTCKSWASAARGTSVSTSRAPSRQPHADGHLDPVTRQDAASDFFGEENVPMQAITMGVGTILEAARS